MLIAAVSVVIGMVFANLQLRELVKTRQTDLVWRLHSEINEREMLESLAALWNLEFEDYQDFVRKYGAPVSGKPVPIAFLKVSNFLEGVGVLLKRRLVSIDMISELLPVEPVWEKIQVIVVGMRRETGNLSFYEWFEYLYNKSHKRDQGSLQL